MRWRFAPVGKAKKAQEWRPPLAFAAAPWPVGTFCNSQELCCPWNPRHHGVRYPPTQNPPSFASVQDIRQSYGAKTEQRTLMHTSPATGQGNHNWLGNERKGLLRIG
eukprot:33067-Pelagomonas_calceolata.AAC.1